MDHVLRLRSSIWETDFPPWWTGSSGHESRDRVLAHLATCTKCKAEADAQRRLKNVFAEMAPPPPSESFLACLQGLPGGDGDSDAEEPPGGGPLRRSRLLRREKRRPARRVRVRLRPRGPARPDSTDSFVRGRGLAQAHRIHDVSRHDTDRSASGRGMRFAFVAAGAVSLAARSRAQQHRPSGSSHGSHRATPRPRRGAARG
ncbi:hypothetical protein ACRAWF_41715 [Streptomyces sp. L7]